MNNMLKFLAVAAVAGIVFLSSCSKKDNPGNKSTITTTAPPDTTGTLKADAAASFPNIGLR